MAQALRGAEAHRHSASRLLPILLLPDELIVMIFQSTILSQLDLMQVDRTCRRCHAIMQDTPVKQAHWAKSLSPDCSIEQLTSMMEKLHLSPQTGSSWLATQHYWMSRKYVVIVDNSSSMSQPSAPDAPNRWTKAMDTATLLIERLGYLTTEGVSLWASEPGENNSFSRKQITTKEECELFLAPVPLLQSQRLANAVRALFETSDMQTAVNREVIIISDFEYPFDNLKSELQALVKQHRKHNKKKWKPITFHFCTVLQPILEPIDENFLALLKYKTSKKVRLQELTLEGLL